MVAEVSALRTISGLIGGTAASLSTSSRCALVALKEEWFRREGRARPTESAFRDERVDPGCRAVTEIEKRLTRIHLFLGVSARIPLGGSQSSRRPGTAGSRATGRPEGLLRTCRNWRRHLQPGRKKRIPGGYRAASQNVRQTRMGGFAHPGG